MLPDSPIDTVRRSHESPCLEKPALVSPQRTFDFMEAGDEQGITTPLLPQLAGTIEHRFRHAVTLVDTLRIGKLAPGAGT